MPLGTFVKRNGLELAVSATALAALALANFLVLRPFLPALLWAIILAVSTWPVLVWLRARCGQRRTLAVVLMMLGLLAVVAVPSALLIVSVIQSTPTALGAVRAALEGGLPPMPLWVAQLPLIGPQINMLWSDWAAHPDHLLARLEPYGERIFGWLTGSATSVGLALITLVLTLLFTAALYIHGERLLAGLKHWARRFGGAQAEQMIQLTGRTLRSVALGVVGTALIQSIFAAAAFAVAGIGQVSILFVLTLASALIQMGAAPVILLIALWQYLSGSSTTAIGLALWAVVVGGMDNVLRPVLIRQGVNLPMWLIFAGVIGGLLAFGIIGLFAGPVALALSHQLVMSASNSNSKTNPASQ